MSQRQSPRCLHRVNREVAADVTHPRQLQQAATEKAVIRAQIRHHHLQQKIRFPRHQKRRYHLRQRRHRRIKRLGLFVVVAFDLDPDKHRQPQPDFIAIKIGLIAANHPRFFQHPHPAQTRRCRQADFIRQLDVAQAPVPLQGGEDFAVERVQFHVWQIPIVIAHKASRLCQLQKLLKPTTQAPAPPFSPRLALPNRQRKD